MRSKADRGIYQRGNTYIVDIRVNGKRAVEVCQTHNMALIRRDELRAQLRRQTEPGQPSAPADSSTSWTIGKAVKVSSEVRWNDKRNGMKSIGHAMQACDFFGKETLLDAITTARLDEYVRHLKSMGNGPGTINRKTAAVSALFTDAMHRDGCTRRPRVIRQAEPTHRIRYLSAEEETTITALLRQWNEVAVLEAVTVLLDTGMRVGELMALKIQDIDLRANLISIWQNKGDLPRSVPMTERVQKIIGDRCISSKNLVFYNLQRPHLEYTWSRLRSAMDLDDDGQFVLHALRHTCATRLVQRNVSLFVVQKLLGHSSITVTEKYAHLSDRELVQAIQVLQGQQRPASNDVGDFPTNVGAAGSKQERGQLVSA